MELMSTILHVGIVLIFLRIISKVVNVIQSRKIKIETKALCISLITMALSSIILIIPMEKGIQNSFAMGGLIVAALLFLFVVWLEVVKKLRHPLYEKSTRLLEKWLLNLI